MNLQRRFEENRNNTSSIRGLLSGSARDVSPNESCDVGSPRVGAMSQKTVTLTTQVFSQSIKQHTHSSQSSSACREGCTSSHIPIRDLCLFLQGSQGSNVGVIFDDSDHCFELTKFPETRGTALSTDASLISLPELSRDHHQKRIELTDVCRLAI